MSRWAEMAADQRRFEFLERWVSRDDPHLAVCPEMFRDQYRYTLARARAAEHELKEHRAVLDGLKRLLR